MSASRISLAVALTFLICGCRKNPAAQFAKVDVVRQALVDVTCGDAVLGAGLAFTAGVVSFTGYAPCPEQQLKVAPHGRPARTAALEWSDPVSDAAVVSASDVGPQGIEPAVAERVGLPLLAVDHEVGVPGQLVDDAFSDFGRHSFLVEYERAMPRAGLPLIDAAGRVIALVGRPISERRGVAVPVWRLIAEGFDASRSPAWSALAARAKEATAREDKAFFQAATAGKTFLGGAAIDREGGLYALLLRRPPLKNFRAELLLETPGGQSCKVSVAELLWRQLPYVEESNEPLETYGGHLIHYFQNNKVVRGLWAARPRLEVTACGPQVKAQDLVGQSIQLVDGASLASTARIARSAEKLEIAEGVRSLPQEEPDEVLRLRLEAARKQVDELEAMLASDARLIERVKAQDAKKLPEAQQREYLEALGRIKTADSLRDGPRRALEALEQEAAHQHAPQ